jgi:hypothetical protein
LALPPTPFSAVTPRHMLLTRYPPALRARVVLSLCENPDWYPTYSASEVAALPKLLRSMTEPWLWSYTQEVLQIGIMSTHPLNDPERKNDRHEYCAPAIRPTFHGRNALTNQSRREPQMRATLQTLRKYLCK